MLLKNLFRRRQRRCDLIKSVRVVLSGAGEKLEAPAGRKFFSIKVYSGKGRSTDSHIGDESGGVYIRFTARQYGELDNICSQSCLCIVCVTYLFIDGGGDIERYAESIGGIASEASGDR